jgi:hypothetical protein
VFLLFAEDTGLLPADNDLYARAYSAGGLYTELEQRVADSRDNEAELDHTYPAWDRLLALFTVIYRGVGHPQLGLQAVTEVDFVERVGAGKLTGLAG